MQADIPNETGVVWHVSRWLAAGFLMLGFASLAPAEDMPAGHAHDVTAEEVAADHAQDGSADGLHAGHAHSGNLLLFPAITGFQRSSAGPDFRRSELRPEVDVFYTADHGRLRFLAEYLASSEEREMERFQVGWLLPNSASLWMGRFHTPLGAWNAEHHHGAFLQTSISRPSIVSFEDENGLLPTHVTGAMLEGTLDERAGLFNYSLGMGRGPKLFVYDQLEPVQIRHPSKGGKQTITGHVSFRPQAETGWELGVFAGTAHIPVRDDPTLTEASLNLSGMFYKWDSNRFRLIAEAFRVASRLDSAAGSLRANFTAAYAQPEYRIGADWTVFGRIEANSAARDNAYVNLFPETIVSREAAGVRLNLARNQALKLEASRNERQDGLRFGQLALQWSMVYQ
jgi:hypothetical protein